MPALVNTYFLFLLALEAKRMTSLLGEFGLCSGIRPDDLQKVPSYYDKESPYHHCSERQSSALGKKRAPVVVRLIRDSILREFVLSVAPCGVYSMASSVLFIEVH